MKRADQVVGLCMLALSAVLYFGTAGLAVWIGPAPGPRFMPLVVGAVGAALAVMLLIDTVRRTIKEPPIDWPAAAGALRVLGVAASVFAFAGLVQLLGFILGALTFVLILLLGVLRQPVLPSVATAIVVAALIYLIFIRWLAIALPRGFFGI